MTTFSKRVKKTLHRWFPHAEGKGSGSRAASNTTTASMTLEHIAAGKKQKHAERHGEAAIATVTRAGFPFFDVEISSKEVLKQSTPFFQCLNQSLLAAQFHQHIALVQLQAEAPACALLVVNDQTSDTEIAEVMRLARENQFQVDAAYFATPELIFQIAQGSLDSKQGLNRQSKSDPFWEQFRTIVQWAYDNKADDIDFAYDTKSPTSQICFKIEGIYSRPRRFSMQSELMLKVLGAAYFKSNGGGQSNFDHRIVQQVNIEFDLENGVHIKLRWNGFPNEKGTAVTLRKHVIGTNSTIRSLDDCGYLPADMDIFQRALRSKRGMICFAGEVGSGKSNSLAAIARLLPTSLKVQTIEDPVELEIPNAYQTTVARNLAAAQTQSSTNAADSDFYAFTQAIFRSALDVLYLGEIRDIATGAVAKQVLQSGHALLTTTHAQDGPGIISRFISSEIGIPASVLATRGIIKLLVYQSLLPTNCPHCALTVEQHISQCEERAQATEPERAYFDRLKYLYNIDPTHYRLRNPQGCTHCRKPEFPERNGTDGRTTVYEIIELDDRMREIIADWNPIAFEKYWRSLSDGRFDSETLTGKTAMECGIYKAYRGLVDPRDVEAAFVPFETLEIQKRQKEKQEKGEALRVQ